MSVTSVNQDVFAAETGMSLTATAEEAGNIITINGDCLLYTSDAADE